MYYVSNLLLRTKALWLTNEPESKNVYSSLIRKRIEFEL